ncbi:MAG: adenylate kinase [Bacteroidota bacterium]
MKYNIVLFGPPGSGKGTQSALLLEKYQLIHISTGNLLREEIAAKTVLGLEAQKLMDAGLLVPDEVVIQMIQTQVEKHKNSNGFIFDGFPRTQFQAESLDTLLVKFNTKIHAMLALEVSTAELLQRLLERGKISGRADDQNKEIIADRITEYQKKTAPLKNYYQAQNKYHEIIGTGNIEEIFARLCQTIDEI